MDTTTTTHHAVHVHHRSQRPGRPSGRPSKLKADQLEDTPRAARARGHGPAHRRQDRTARSSPTSRSPSASSAPCSPRRCAASRGDRGPASPTAPSSVGACRADRDARPQPPEPRQPPTSRDRSHEPAASRSHRHRSASQCPAAVAAPRRGRSVRRRPSGEPPALRREARWTQVDRRAGRRRSSPGIGAPPPRRAGPASYDVDRHGRVGSMVDPLRPGVAESPRALASLYQPSAIVMALRWIAVLVLLVQRRTAPRRRVRHDVRGHGLGGRPPAPRRGPRRGRRARRSRLPSLRSRAGDAVRRRGRVHATRGGSAVTGWSPSPALLAADRAAAALYISDRLTDRHELRDRARRSSGHADVPLAGARRSRSRSSTVAAPSTPTSTSEAGDATRVVQAMADQLGLAVVDVEPFGLEGSGGSSPLRMTLDDGTRLFGKIYSASHERADRWYRIGRTILYGQLEDEAPDRLRPPARRLRGLHAALPHRPPASASPTPYGVVELTPNHEYLVVTELFEDAAKLGDPAGRRHRDRRRPPPRPHDVGHRCRPPRHQAGQPARPRRSAAARRRVQPADPSVARGARPSTWRT